MSGNEEAQIGQLLDAMAAAADAARDVTVSHFRAPLHVDDKSQGATFDPVTCADRDAEALIRVELGRRFPDIAFIGEESTADTDNAGEASTTLGKDACWVVDPIDGTRAYITGMPLWGTLIAYHDGARPLLGLLDQPVLGERYIGRPGEAALLIGNDRFSLQTRKGVGIAQSVLCCTSPDMFSKGDERARFDALASKVRLVRYGGDCYAYAQLAAGHVDLVVESDLKPWDVLALVPLVEAAGGHITTWSGEPAEHGGQIVAAGTAELHAEALAILSGR